MVCDHTRLEIVDGEVPVRCALAGLEPADPRSLLGDSSAHIFDVGVRLERYRINNDVRLTFRIQIDSAPQSIFEDGYIEPTLVQALLHSAGIPVVDEFVSSKKEEVLAFARRTGFPVVAKVVGPVHKSDVGGVVLNIKSEEHLALEFDRMMKIPDVTSILIQPMLKGTELFIGAKYEEKFGHVVFCGLGGIFVEVLKDVSSGLAPLSYEEQNSPALAAVREGAAGFAARFLAAAGENFAEDGNAAVSPVSVYAAMAMAAECAAGKTREQLLAALNTDGQTLREGFGLFYRSLARDGKEKIVLSDSVWLDESVAFRQDCLDTLAESYHCASFAADFRGANERANEAVRNFIKEQTNGLIDQDPSLGETTRFALINTLYVKTKWDQEGNDLPETDETYAFRNADGTTVTTRLLRAYAETGVAYEGENFTSFYAATNIGCRLVFLFLYEGLTPKDVFTQENIAAAADADYGGYDENGSPRYGTRCLFPAFEAVYKENVSPILQDMGVTDLFTPACDLSAALETEGESVLCNKVQHVARLKVEAKGIEGAAATIADAAPESDEAPVEVFDFVVDRAFAYLLLAPDGTILFAGAVNKI